MCRLARRLDKQLLKTMPPPSSPREEQRPDQEKSGKISVILGIGLELACNRGSFGGISSGEKKRLMPLALGESLDVYNVYFKAGQKLRGRKLVEKLKKSSDNNLTRFLRTYNQ